MHDPAEPLRKLKNSFRLAYGEGAFEADCDTVECFDHFIFICVTGVGLSLCQHLGSLFNPGDEDRRDKNKTKN